MLNLFQHLIKSKRYETLKQVQGDKKRVFRQALILLFVLLISSAIADEVSYFYDDNGRLVTVTNVANNTRALYQYDEVGNLIAIYNETSTAQALPPVLSGIEPEILLIGETYNVLITGQNLLTTNSITSDNPDVTVKFIAAIDTKILAVLSIADTATAGQANITVTHIIRLCKHSYKHIRCKYNTE